MKLPRHRHLSIYHNPHKAEGESLSHWLRQLQPDATDFSSNEAQQRAIMADELWGLHWEDDHGTWFIFAPTFGELIELAGIRFPDQLTDFV